MKRKRHWNLMLRRSWFLLPIDVLSLLVAHLLSFELRFNFNVPNKYYEALLWFLFLGPIIYIGIFIGFRLYSRVWKYAGVRDAMAIVLATSTAAILVEISYLLLIRINLPLSVWLSSYLLSLALVSATRLVVVAHGDGFRRRTKQVVKGSRKKRVLIYGAGSAGAIVVKEVQRDRNADWDIVGFIDDDKDKHGLILSGIKILGGRSDLERIIRVYAVDMLLIAIPSLPRRQLREMVDELQIHKIPILIIPPYTRWAVEDLYTHIRPVEVEDLLGRDPLPVDVSKVGKYLTGQRVLVTGAGGSIGSEICRQVAALRPAELILLGRGENSIFEIDHELRHTFRSVKISCVIADVRDQRKMSAVFSEFRPTVVFHAAAHKHVPLMEANPDEAFMNNVMATKSLAELSGAFKVERFILISSDKAVRPTNVMGASKRVAEMLVQSLSGLMPDTKFITVRFGNVLGSRGSVIRIFREQIARGGPVTITDERMVRYFMTIPEAVRLVIEAGAMGSSGKVYLLDMGEPVRIVDLAERMIRLSGFEPGVDIPIQFIGIRPGEKLFEELSRPSDSVCIDEDGRIWVVDCPVMPYDELLREVSSLMALYEDDKISELGQRIKELAWWEPNVSEPVKPEVHHPSFVGGFD
jgi:FlaA1/EpsC-like NDP-sugar epimerase